MTIWLIATHRAHLSEARRPRRNMKSKGGPGRRRTQRHTKATNGTRSRRQTRAQRHPPGKAPPGADPRKPNTQQPDCRSQPGLTDGWSYCAPFLAACFFLALCKEATAGFGGIRKPPFCTCHSPHQHNLPIPNSADARRLLEDHQNTKYPLYCLVKKKSVPDRSLATVFYEAHMSQTNNGGCGRGGLLLVILPAEPRTLFTATDHNFRAFRIAPVGALP